MSERDSHLRMPMELKTGIMIFFINLIKVREQLIKILDLYASLVLQKKKRKNYKYSQRVVYTFLTCLSFNSRIFPNRA